MIVLAFGMSMPFSTIVVDSSTSDLCAMKSSIAFSSDVLAHLSVADDDARLGHEPLHQVAHREDRLDAVVDEEDLAAARHLVADRARDDLRDRT